MNDVSFRLFKESDLDFAYKMVLAEQWNDRREDLKRVLECEPQGCFIAESQGNPIGHVFTVSYGKLGWVGLLIVGPEHREKSVGTELMRRAMEYLLGHGVETIRLEAVPEIANLYRKLGFMDEYDSLRFVGVPTNIRDLPSGNAVFQMHAKMVREVAELDRTFFGGNRTKVIERLQRDHPHHCFVHRKASGIDGYIMCREGDVGYKVGPWICKPRNAEAARQLLCTCLSTLEPDQKVYVGVLDRNEAAVDLMREYGFKQYSKSIRMTFGKKLNERTEGVFAIGGPMKG